MIYRYVVLAITFCLLVSIQITYSESQPFRHYNQFNQLLVSYDSESAPVLSGYTDSFGKNVYAYPNNAEIRDKLSNRRDVIVNPHEPFEPLLENMRESTHVDMVHSVGYTGDGVVVGVFENGIVVDHADFENRLQNREEFLLYDSQHKTHVAGIIAGGGVLNSNMVGVAPDVTLISDDTAQILDDMSALAETENLFVSNHSYGSSGCAYLNIYNQMSERFDIAFKGNESYTPHVIVSSVGNSAGCTSDGFNTVLGGHQQSKNVILVGALKTSNDSEIADYSSRGPNSGGMIAPTVVSIGSIVSTCIDDSYCTASGTSMSSPTVAGVVALMNEALPLSNDWVPSSYRAVLAHTAVDLGNVGPDYTYGFGRVDAMKAVEKAENNYQVVVLELAPYQTQDVVINGYANDPLKVTMGYADDPSAIISGGINGPVLINDVDLRVEFSNGEVVYPYVLNPDHPSVEATRGVDTRNVTEQVEGTYALSGTHKIVVENKSDEWVTVTVVSDNDMLIDPLAVTLVESDVVYQANGLVLATIMAVGLLMMGTVSVRKLSVRRV